MKKKIITLFISVLSILVILTSFFSVCAFGLNPVFQDTYLGELPYKVERLKNTKKRIIFVGGSSVPFAIHSKMIEDNLNNDYEVVDFGLYAGLGSKVMLEIVKKEMRKDDIIIFMPEQNSQTLSLYFNSDNYFQAIDGHYDLLSYLDSDDYSKMIASFFDYSVDKLQYNTIKEINMSGVYQRSSFDEYGDINYEDREYNILNNLYDKTQLITYDSNDFSDDFISYLNDFEEECFNKECDIYYAFAPANKLSVTSTYKEIDDYYSFLEEQLHFPILGNPHDSIINENYFYDTNYHLNYSGSIYFTKKMIQNLKILFDDHSVTDIEEPSYPEIPVSKKDGDNTYVKYFDYVLDGNYYKITGITKDIGNNPIIPYRHNNKIITSFDSIVFRNNDDVESITIQDNIKEISDNSFIGCDNLKKIYLNNEKPNTIKVGSGLLSNLDIKIVVPKGYLATYLLDYTWSMYSDYLIEE